MRHKFGWIISLGAGALIFWMTVYQMREKFPEYPIDTYIINTALVWLVSIFLGTLYLPKMGSIKTGFISDMTPLDAIVWAVVIGGLGPLFLVVILFINKSNWRIPKSNK